MRGAVRFDVLATVVLIVVLAGVLLNQLNEAQRFSERTLVDMQVAGLRADLQLMIASQLARGENIGLSDWAGRNPAELVWGGAPQAPSAGGFGLSGPWRWDERDGVLTYVYRGGECLQLRLARVKPGSADGWLLGGGLILAAKHKNDC